MSLGLLEPRVPPAVPDLPKGSRNLPPPPAVQGSDTPPSARFSWTTGPYPKVGPLTRSILLGSVILAACGGAEASNLAQARIDTLSNGVVRVMSEGPTGWSDSAGAALVEAARFQGEDGTPAELGQPRSLAVDGAGRVYVVDSKPAVIKVFTPDGQLVRTIGHEGEGPGEFRVGFIAVRDEHLVLHDPQLARTSVWDTAGTFIRSWHSACCYWTDIQIDRNNLIYVPDAMAPSDKEARARGTPYVQWTLEGVARDTVWVPRREEGKYWTVSLKRGGKVVTAMSTNIPFMPVLAHALHPDGGIVYGWTGSYEIVRSTTGENTARVFGRSWTPDPVSDQRRTAEVEARIKGAAESYGEENVRSAFRLEDIPSVLPAYFNLRVDPTGRVWARRWAVADTSKSYFDLFDSTGAYLGPVTAPYRLNEWGMQAWARDMLIALIEDEEGRPTVVRLRLEIPARSK